MRDNKEIEAALRDENNPIKPPMDKYQRVALTFREDGQLIIIHTRPFREILAWVEFDVDTRRIALLSRRGSIFDTGFEIAPSKAEQIKNAKQASVLWFADKKIKDIYTLPVTVRDTDLIGSGSVH